MDSKDEFGYSPETGRSLRALREEPHSSSVASFLPLGHPVEWMVETDTRERGPGVPEGFYLRGCTGESLKKILNIEKRAALRFFVSFNDFGVPLFAAEFHWGRGEVRASIRSANYKSTIEAYRELVEVINKIPAETPGLNWRNELFDALPKGTAARVLVSNENPVGIPAFKISFVLKGVELSSGAYPSKKLALDDAIRVGMDYVRANELDFQDKPANEKTAQQPVPTVPPGLDWRERVAQATHGRLPATHIQVAFLEGPVCKISSVLPERSFAVTSGKAKTREMAFASALDFFLTTLDRPRSHARPLRHGRGENKELAALLQKAVKAWRAEHAWLMQSGRRTRDDDSRLLQLSRYFVLLDPLRVHELDRGIRPEVFAALEKDVAIFAARQDPKMKKQKVVDWLRALAGKRLAETGAPLRASAAFSKAASSYGADPGSALEFLVSEGFVRKERSGLMFLSTRGVNWMEEMLTSDMSQTALVASLSPQTAAMLFELKSALEKSS